jgi:hypothetical protein
MHMLLQERDELLTPADVAERTKTSIATCYRWMNPPDPAAPRLESFKLGASRRISETALVDFLRKVAR